ncbi:transmembrane protein 183-like [Agrilus planipennis]|uniref:Transmembrane protein 183 n=1 Tax=Agrilus planipennis TaxID=224129 RepID=A0A1W4X8X2_AGRPL|nr:transmembrane protein 183 [Agrilus planipennis]XP_018328839.1 transmembrane protein 183 [Agrilus planipennis]XP_025834628.1 transmembrane protein 183-like [Agrilus planipennis]
MSKSRTKLHKLKNNSLADVTINDFANSVKPVYRPKKLVSNVISVLHTIEKEKSWDEKEEYDSNFDFISQENEDGTFSLVAKARTNSTSDNKNMKENTGHVYPLDLWFLLSEYIRPEDISVFAAVCRHSYEVVKTVAFWRRLYDRFCKNAKNLPKVYQPDSINRVYGLKPTVIRALYCVYPPFVSRLLYLNGITKNDPNLLKHKQCILQWHEKKKKDWFYYFKLKDFIKPPHCSQGTYNHLNLIKVLGDISANPDENCTVLQVRSTNFVAIPIVLGLTLTSVSQPLSKGYCHHSLHLGFGSAIRSTTHNLQTENTCVIDPVIDLKILNWWHPLYPQSGKIQIMPCEEES